MKCTKGLLCIQDDLLVVRWRNPDTGEIFSQRKRLPNNTTRMVKEMQEHYLKSTVHAVKYLRNTWNYGLKEALSFLNHHRRRR